jgi:hypothetical protein
VLARRIDDQTSADACWAGVAPSAKTRRCAPATGKAANATPVDGQAAQPYQYQFVSRLTDLQVVVMGTFAEHYLMLASGPCLSSAYLHGLYRRGRRIGRPQAVFALG